MADGYFTFDGNDSLITDRAGYLDDFDLRIDFSLDDWTPADVQPLLVEGNTTTRNWKVQIGTSGEIGFTLFGIADYAGDTPTLQDGNGRVQIRITRNRSTGIITYYNRASGTDLSVNTGWTELGGGETGSTGAAPNNGSIKLRIGHDDNDAKFLSGKVYQVWIEQTINGTTPLYDPDFRTTTQDDWSSLPATDAAGNSWAVGTGSPTYTGGPTLEQQSVAGTITPAGAPSKQSFTSKTGTVAPNGTVASVRFLVRRPDDTVDAGGWDTGPTSAQDLDQYTSDASDSTWIEATPV